MKLVLNIFKKVLALIAIFLMFFIKPFIPKEFEDIEKKRLNILVDELYEQNDLLKKKDHLLLLAIEKNEQHLTTSMIFTVCAIKKNGGSLSFSYNLIEWASNKFITGSNIKIQKIIDEEKVIYILDDPDEKIPTGLVN